MTDVKTKARINYLDGIRGSAALLVVFGHFKYAFFDENKNSRIVKYSWNLLNHLYLSAGFCVQLFFVLSGFVLTYNAVNKNSFLSKQWSKRVYRLFVPVFISSLLYFIFSHTGLLYFKELYSIHSNEWIGQQWTSGYTFLRFLTGCVYDLMILSDFHFILNINSALWTIPIEFYWSYILFICLWGLKFIRTILLRNVLLGTAVLFAIRFAPFIGVVYGLLFLAGALLAINYSFLISFFTGKRKYYLLICTIGITYCVDQGLFPEFSHFFFQWSYLVATLFILCAMTIIKIQKFFLYPFIQWLGRISFPLYLLHMLVIGSLGAWLYVQYAFLRADSGLFVLLSIILFVSLGLAHLFTKYIDEPLMTMFDKIYTKLKRQETIQ